MKTKYNELLNVLNKGIKDECIALNIKEPDFISKKDWLTVFDIIEKYYVANDKMDKYLDFIYWYVRTVILYSNTYNKNTIVDLFSNVFTSSGALDNIDNVMRYKEGSTFQKELKRRIKDNNDVDKRIQVTKEKMKILLDRVKKLDYKEHKNLDKYEDITSRITDDEFMVFFDVLDAHYEANGITDEYLADMKEYIKAILLFSYLNSNLSNVEIMANILHIIPNGFDHTERLAIALELNKRINGIEEDEFEFIRDKVKKTLDGKRYVISLDNNGFSMTGPV